MIDNVLIWAGCALAAFAALVFVAHLPLLPLLRIATLKTVPDRKLLVACVIDALFFFDPDHCRKAHNAEFQKLQLPQAYRT